MAKPNSQAPSSKAWRPLTVKTDEELEELLVQPGIKVIDIYGWAGPCEAVVNRFAELKFEVNDDAALQFLMVEAKGCKLLEQAQEQVKTCSPRFLIFRDGWLKEDVKAPNPVAVKKAVKALLAPPPPVEALEPPKENPFAAAVAARKAAAAEEKARVKAAQPAPPPGSYQALLQAVS